jgi:hypothetical protein
MHDDKFVAPTSGEAVPAGHAMQLEAPTALYFPAGHVMQAIRPADGAYCPAAQVRHSVCPLWLLNVPTGQFVHWTAEATEYCPALQRVQLAWFAREKDPAAQARHEAAPARANDPAAHGTQSETAVAPVFGEAVPAGHWEQAYAPELL